MKVSQIAAAKIVATAVEDEILDNLVGGTLNRIQADRIDAQFAAAKAALQGCQGLQVFGRDAKGQVTQLAGASVAATDSAAEEHMPQADSDMVSRVFETGTAVVVGPFKHQDYSCLKVAVPLEHSANEPVGAVLVLEMDAEDWNAQIVAAAALPVLLAIGVAGVAIFSRRLAIRRSQCGGKAYQGCLGPAPLVVLAIGLAVSALFAVRAHKIEVANRHDAFNSLAVGRASLVAETLSRVCETELESLARFYEGSERVTANEFSEFTAFLERDSAVYAWAWVPALKSTERETWETAVRAEGFPGFEVWEFDQPGQRVVAKEREIHYPVERIVPVGTNRRVLGHDYGSDPLIRNAIEEAARSRSLTATEPMVLAQDQDALTAILVCRPVFSSHNRDTLRGCAIVALQMKTLLEYSTMADDAILAEIALGKKNAPPDSLATSWRGGEAPATDLVTNRLVFAFGRVFALKMHAGPAFLRLHPMSQAWLTGLLGLAISIAATISVWAVCRRREYLVHLVAEQTHELKESNERFKQLAQQSGTYHWQVDAYGRYTYVSEVIESVCGYRPDEIVGHKCLYDLHPDIGRNAFKAAASSVFERREPFVGLENPVQAKNGGIVWVSTNGIPLIDEHGVLLGYRGSDTDITERMRAYEALKYAHEQLSQSLDFSNSVFASMPMPVFVKDRDGRYLDCNRAFTEMHGLSRDDIRGKTADQIWPGEQGRLCRESDHEVLRTKRFNQYSTRIHVRNGGDRDVLFIKNVVIGSNGEVAAVIGAHVDVMKSSNNLATTAASYTG